MIPIHQLLSRIRWDPGFGRDRFVIGYYDRVEGKMNHVGLRDVELDPESRFMFQVRDEEGESHSIPFHRVKEVFRNGELIWHRKR